MSPQVHVPCYGLPKIQKTNTPLRPIVSSRDSVTYGIAKVLAKILKPLVGKSLHHVHSTKDFMERVSKVTLQPGECFCSYDVTALFTSVPVDPALIIIQGLLEQDTSLQKRTVLLVQNIKQLLGFCLHNTYFSFQGQFYEQVKVAAMGSLVSPILANLYIKHFERTALKTATTTPRLWLRYVDDIFVIQQEEHKQNFLEHINNVDPAIKFTVENNKKDGAIPNVDTTVKPQSDNTLSLTVYRKPMHTDQYLQWDSHHHLADKYSVISTIIHRATTVCTQQNSLTKK